MSRIRYVFYLCAGALLCLASCSKGGQDKSSLQMQMPPHPNTSAKSVNTSVSDKVAAFCYLINVTGEGLSSQTKSCYPETGIVSDFLPPLATLEMSVARGKSRTVELFGYLAKPGESCEKLGKGLHDVDLNRLFLIASQSGISMEKEEVTVSLVARFPGLTQNYPRIKGLPASCLAGLPPLFEDVQEPEGGVLRGTRYALIGMTGSGADSAMQKGSKYRVHAEVKNAEY